MQRQIIKTMDIGIHTCLENYINVYFFFVGNTKYFKYSNLLDWPALHLKVGSGIDSLFLEIIRSYVDKFNVFLLC